MATPTTHYGFTKPGVNDYVDISVLNANFDNLDTVIYKNQLSAQAALDDIAPEYDATATYSVGDYVTYNKTLYKCATAITTAEAFDDTKWTAVKVGGELKSHDARISDLEAGVELEGAATNSFDDGIDSYFKKVVSSIVPVQAGSGTPSPTNKRPITGFTECTILNRGINQWDEQWELGIINYDTGKPQDGNGLRSKNYINVIANTNYYMLWNSDNYGTNCYRMEYDSNKNFLRAIYFNGGTFQVPNDCKYIKFYIWRISTNPITGYYNDISINYPSTDTAYHAYNGTTATISFGSAGTVYGGYVDLISGKLLVDRVCLTINSITGTWGRQATSTSGVYRWSVQIRPTSAVQAGETEGFMASMLANSSGNDIFAGRASDNSVGFNVTNLYIRCDNATDTAELMNILGSCQILYPLATPQEYQLTPAQLRSLVGANRLTSSTGEVIEVEYIKNKTIAWLLDLIRA